MKDFFIQRDLEQQIDFVQSSSELLLPQDKIEFQV